MSAFFVLMPGSWNEADEFLSRPIVGHRQGRPATLPWVAVASGVEAGRYVLVRRDPKQPDAMKALLAEAQRHVDAQPVGWQVAESRGLIFKAPVMLRAVVALAPGVTAAPTDDLSSEQLLSRKALAAAASRLGSPSLIAVVPKRGWLLVALGAPGELPAMTKMHQAAAGVFGRAGADGIAPCGFFVQNGELIGANVVAPSGGFLHMARPQDGAWFF
jgi:hypothetical protein